MEEFKLPPYSSLAGSTFGNFLKVVSGRRPDSNKYIKLLATQLIVLGMTPLHWYENLLFRKTLSSFQFRKPPLFILGHWRSGTTLLHNLLCQDDVAAYVTTYHSVFPNNLKSKFLFKAPMQKRLPETRPGDRMKLNVDYPQEEEFALTNVIPYTYYNFFYFPRYYREYYERYVRFKNVDQAIKNKWKTEYRKLLAKAVINSGGEHLIVKNPVNTARIRMLLEMFPEARFIHIHRNPVEVFLSTKKFFSELFPTIWLQKVSPEFITEMILDVYEKMYLDYFSSKDLIPASHLYELKFAELEEDALLHLENIYEQLNIDDFATQKPKFITYLNRVKGHQKGKHEISQHELDRLVDRWAPIIELLGYRVGDLESTYFHPH